MAQFIHLNRIYEVDAENAELDPCSLSKQKLVPIIEEMLGKDAVSAFENKFELFFPNNYKDLFGLYLHHLTTIFDWVAAAEVGINFVEAMDIFFNFVEIGIHFGVFILNHILFITNFFFF